jgi:putative membrane-bound dehydrogenase-like protein
VRPLLIYLLAIRRVAYGAMACLALLLPASLSAQSGDRPGEAQPPPPPHLKVPPSPPLKAEEALETFRVAPGFKVEIVASEPLVFDPVALAFGADGRLWVVEMRGFMPNVDGVGEDAPIGTIAVLEDVDRDGRMDKRTEFAGGFVLPRAVAPIADGVLVAEPPHLWFLKDTDGDGKADERIEIASDYGDPSNPEHAANGLLWGLDNWIYSANHTARYRYERGTWRAEPTIFRGQWGIAQDDVGRLVYNTNSDPLRMDVLPAEYLLRNPNLAAPRGINVQLARPEHLPVWPGRITIGVNRGYQILRDDGTLPIVTAACAPVIYRGALFPEGFRDNAFIAEPAGNLVKRILIEERDGVPSARNVYARTEFLTSTDERFRPVNLYNGPDGALYVVDMYRGVIQHRLFVTTYLRRQIEERGLEAPIGMGRIYRIVPDGAPPLTLPNLARMTTEELVAALAHENAWWRETAQRLLVERDAQAAVPALRNLLRTSPSSRARLHALWTLSGLQAVDWDSLAHALRDPSVHVAVVAARLAEAFFATRPERTMAALKARAAWGELEFQRQLALSLGAAPAAVADAELVELAEVAGDRAYVADAIVSSVHGRELSLFLRLKNSKPETRARLAPVLVSLGAAVLKSGRAEDIDKLLAELGNESWLDDAIVGAVERFIPGEPGRKREVALPVEPHRLKAFAESSSAHASRAKAALALLRWPEPSSTAKGQSAPRDPAQRARIERGREAFAVCAACHQQDGQGQEGLAPPLVGSRWVTGDAGALVRIVLNGKRTGDSAMLPLRSLDDETIAVILTYVRASWGHNAAPIEAAQVRAIRRHVEEREDPWTDAELERVVR